MYSLEPQDALRRTSVIKSNLLSATRVDIDSLVKCLQTDKIQGLSKQKQKHAVSRDTAKNRLSRAYFPNKYKMVQPALRIKFNQLQQKQILVPSEVQVQAHIVNVSFGVNKRKRPKKQASNKLPTSLSRPKTSTNIKHLTVMSDWSQGKQIPIQSSSNRYRQKIYSPTKIRIDEIEFTNQQIVTLNPTLTMINKSNMNPSKNQEDQAISKQLYEKTYSVMARKSAPLDSKTANLKKEFFHKRKFMMRKDHFTFGLEGKRNTADNKIELYRDFLWKINFSCGLYVEAELQMKKPFKVYVGGGNNSILIKSLMKRRFWWVIVDKMADDVNFTWTQLKVQGVYKLQAQSNKELQEIDKLIEYTKSATVSTIDYSKYLHSRGESPKDRTKYKKIFRGEDLQLWNKHYSKNYKTQSVINDRTYARRIPLMKSKAITSIEKSDRLIVHNHFKSNSYIGNKKAMFYNIKLYYQLLKRDVFRNIPITFHIVKGVNDPEFIKFSEVYSGLEKEKCKKATANTKNIWIMKPGEFTNRGKGITVCGSLEEILSRLKGKERNSDGSVRTFILQKYIQKPFLYHKRKFDIRHYMMISCVNGKMRGYWYQEGYIRTTSTEYNIRNCRNNYIHLTNDAVQKSSEDYGKYQKGNKLSYQDFQKYLDSYYEQSQFNFFETVLPEMKRIGNDAIKSTYSLLDSERLDHNFEVFGLDFMIDENFNTYLIQINTNPCLELSSPLLAKIIPGMLSNALMIGLDPLFPPPYNWPSHKKYQLADSPLQTNKFELIFDQTVDGPQLSSLYSNIKKIDDRMGNIDDEEEQYPQQEGEWDDGMI